MGDWRGEKKLKVDKIEHIYVPIPQDECNYVS